MADRFTRFSERARQVLTRAEEEARRLNNNYIGTEHILLGLIQVPDGVAARVLTELDVRLAEIRAQVEAATGGNVRAEHGTIELTQRAKQVVVLAVDEARALGHDHIGTEHLLLGLCREGGGLAAATLRASGVDLDRVHAEVLRLLDPPATAGTPGAAAEPAVQRPPHDRFENYTALARRALTLAQVEAQRFNHNYIGTEHLLLGLCRLGEGIVPRILVAIGVDQAQVRGMVEFIIGRGDRLVLGEIGLTPRVQRVLDLAEDEARGLGHAQVGPEHLLLGLIREGEGIAASILESLGLSLIRARTLILDILRAETHLGEGLSAERGFPPVGAAGHALVNPFLGGLLRIALDAQQELWSAGQSRLGTEHLLLSLTADVQSLPSAALRAAGIDVPDVRRQIAALEPPREEGVAITRGARVVLERTLREANRLGQEEVGGGHLLLALLAVEEGGAWLVLNSLGVDRAALRTDVERRLGEVT